MTGTFRRLFSPAHLSRLSRKAESRTDAHRGKRRAAGGRGVAYPELQRETNQCLYSLFITSEKDLV